MRRLLLPNLFYYKVGWTGGSSPVPLIFPVPAATWEHRDIG